MQGFFRTRLQVTTGQAATSWKAIFGGSIEPMGTTIPQSPSLGAFRPKESAPKISKIQKYVEITSSWLDLVRFFEDLIAFRPNFAWVTFKKPRIT